MRNPKALLLPFYCDGYDMEAANTQIAQLAEMLTGWGVDVETADPIGDVAAARAASKQYNPYCYDFAVLFAATWSEPRLAAIAARQFFGMPLAVWCVSEFTYHGRRTEMSSAPAAAALKGSLQEMGVKCEFFADLDDSHGKQEKLVALANAARAISCLREAKMGFFGHNFNGITAADFDLSLMRRKLGTEVFSFDVSELIVKMQGFDAESAEYKAMEEKVKSKISGSTGAFLDKIVRMCLGLNAYVQDFELDALDVRCHTELSQTYGLAACLPLSVLGDELPCSCEADLPVMLTQLILTLLSGGQISAYVDLRTFQEDGISAGACGYAPCGVTGNKAEVGGAEAPENGAPAGYLTNKSGLNEGRLTMARMLKYPGGQLKLHLTGATAQQEEVRLQEQFCPYYPMAKLIPDVPMERFMEYVGANHYALVYEEVMAAAKIFCKYLDIELVN